MKNIRFYMPGAVFIVVAVLIVAFPEILVAFIASLIFMAGVAALYIGNHLRKFEIGLNDFYRSSVDDFYAGNSVFRFWHTRR